MSNHLGEILNRSLKHRVSNHEAKSLAKIGINRGWIRSSLPPLKLHWRNRIPKTFNRCNCGCGSVIGSKATACNLSSRRYETRKQSRLLVAALCLIACVCFGATNAVPPMPTLAAVPTNALYPVTITWDKSADAVTYGVSNGIVFYAKISNPDVRGVYDHIVTVGGTNSVTLQLAKGMYDVQIQGINSVGWVTPLSETKSFEVPVTSPKTGIAAMDILTWTNGGVKSIAWSVTLTNPPGPPGVVHYFQLQGRNTP